MVLEQTMITEFKVGAAHTINLGNFESLRVEAHVVVSVPELSAPGELYESAQQQLKILLENTVRAQMRPQDPRRPSPGVDKFLQRQQERS
jgi:hypothetical protein